MIVKRLMAFAVCAAMLLCSGCRKNKNSESPDADPAVTKSTVKKEKDVTIKNYGLPGFLKASQKADVLSNVIYKSFDPASLMVEPKKQPFKGYKCTACFDDTLYIFVDGENYGLLNSLGEELLPSEGISKITAAAAGLLRVTYKDGKTEYYRVDGEKIKEEKVADFDPQRVSFEPLPYYSENEDEADTDRYILCLDGVQIYDAEWSDFKALSADEVDTQKSFEAIYRASSGSVSYYITFDKFYNLTVYECEYGFISMKLRGEEAQCYILDHDHYKDLRTLIGSFGSENRSASVSEEGDDDYIQITLVADTDEPEKVTISPDGFCFTESADGRKFFTVMDTETFTDLVSWINETLASEYNS